MPDEDKNLDGFLDFRNDDVTCKPRIKLVSLRKLAASYKFVFGIAWTLTLIYLSVKLRLLMENVDFNNRQRLKVS